MLIRETTGPSMHGARVSVDDISLMWVFVLRFLEHNRASHCHLCFYVKARVSIRCVARDLVPNSERIPVELHLLMAGNYNMEGRRAVQDHTISSAILPSQASS